MKNRKLRLNILLIFVILIELIPLFIIMSIAIFVLFISISFGKRYDLTKSRVVKFIIKPATYLESKINEPIQIEPEPEIIL